jgi:hypothetical protein
MRRIVWLLVIGYWLFVVSGISLAKEDVGTVVAIRNKAIIERDKKEIEARVKDGILLKDTVSTREASRAKMLFIDDSVLTMGEKSRVVIKEFLYKDGKGKSIFNLLDGKMRSVVGKTEFEVLTPTAVAAARGTVILFEVGVRDGKRFTTIVCLEGEVSVRSADPSIVGIVTLKPGMMVTVFEKEPLPIPTMAPAEEVERLKRDTEIGTYEISIPTPVEVRPEPPVIELAPSIPPVEQQPVPTTPVRIDLTFPQ